MGSTSTLSFSSLLHGFSSSSQLLFHGFSAASSHLLLGHGLTANSNLNDSDTNTSSTLSEFDSQLALSLHGLEEDFDDQFSDPGSLMNMQWLCRAIELVRSTHIAAQGFLPELRLGSAGRDSKWVQLYLDDNLRLLDVCRGTVKAAMEDIQSYRDSVHMALRALDKACTTTGGIGEAQLRRAKAALDKCSDAVITPTIAGSSTTSSIIRRVSERLIPPSSATADADAVTASAKLMASFVSELLTTGLPFIKPSAGSLHGTPSRRGFDAASAKWAAPFAALQRNLKHLIDHQRKSRRPLLEELLRTDTAVHALQNKIEQLLLPYGIRSKSSACGKRRRTTSPVRPRIDQVFSLRQSTESLRDSFLVLNRSLASLESGVDSLREVLVKSRVLLLDIHLMHLH